MAHLANLTISSSGVTATQTDFPKLVRGSDFTANIWSTATASGGDLRFFLSDGTTEIAREVVSFDNVGEEAEIWIKIPSVSALSDTVIQIHADGVSSDYADSGTPYGRNAVWTDYAAVIHGGATAVDSSGNHTFTANGTPGSVAGEIGDALVVNRGDSYQASTTTELDAVIADDFVVSAWWGFDTGSFGGGSAIIGQNTSTGARWWSYGIWGHDHYITIDNAATRPDSDDASAFSSGLTGIDDGGSYNYLAASIDYATSNVDFYRNGSFTASDSTVSSMTASAHDLRIGDSPARPITDSGTSWYLDEIRIRDNSAGVVDADWIADEHADQSGNAAWHTITAVGGGVSTLVVQDLSHSHTIDNLVLTQANTLALQDVSHAHTIDGIVLSAGVELAPNDINHSHTVDNVALTQANTLAVDEVSHTHTVEAVTVTPSGSIAVDGVDHSQTIDNVALTVQGALTVADMAHNHILDNVALTQAHILTLNDITHAHVIDALNVSPGFDLTVNDLAHSQTIEGASITVSGDVLTVNGLTHVHLTDNVDLTQAGVLSVDGLTHAQLLEIVTLAGIAIGELNGEIYMYAAIDGEVVMTPILTATIH